MKQRFPSCPNHSQNALQMILLSKECKSNRLICNECLYFEDNSSWSDEILETIPLSIALRTPELMIYQVKNGFATKNLQAFFQICNYNLDKIFNDLIQKFEDLILNLVHIKDAIKQQVLDYQLLQGNIKAQREVFIEVINAKIQNCGCNQLKILIDQLNEIQIECQYDEYTKTLNKINEVINDILHNDCANITKNINELLQRNRDDKKILIKPDIYPLLSRITQGLQDYANNIGNLNFHLHSLQIPDFNVLSIDFFSTIQKKIQAGSNKYIESINLIYLGSRDGLYSTHFWKKVDGQNNLLIILKSKINQIFGAYSPCKWESCVSKNVEDPSQTSFIFSQTKNEIYPLNYRYKQYAIHCNKYYGPIFGNGQDLKINGDFSCGSSKLGVGYKCDLQCDSVTHLFGELSPKIIECEIYQLQLS